MINFNSKITKSIIIVIFILSLTISIYVVPASAIVTGTLAPSDLVSLFDMDNFYYFRWRPSSGDSFYPNSTEFRSIALYPYIENIPAPGMTNENSRLIFYGRFIPYKYNASLTFNNSQYSYIRFMCPLGIQNSTKTTIQFMFLTMNSHRDTFSNVERNSLSNNKIIFKAWDSDGNVYDLKSSVFEYNGLVEYSNSGPDESQNGNSVSYVCKVFDIEINDIQFLDYITVDFKPGKDLTNSQVTDLYGGVTKVFYEGANSQLTNIQDSINDLISGIQNQDSILQDMSQQQAEFYKDILELSPSGQDIIDGVIDSFKSSEDDLHDLIDGITVDKPEPEQILPDQQQIMGQYMDSGGSEAVASVLTPLFDEKGPIYIMLFSVLSIALISYVLYGKKAK